MRHISDLLAFRGDRHAWIRRVAETECLSVPATDQWGRAVQVEHVVCHTEYVCHACGAVRDGADCVCEVERADACKIRLARLGEIRA